MEFINYTTYNRVEDIKRLKFIINNLPMKPGQLKILEIGCGNGNISYQLYRYGHDVTGIDISPLTIQHAIEQYGTYDNLRFRVENSEQLNPGPDDKYDVIVCSEVLEHLYDPDKLISNFTTLLNKNGIAIITVPNGFGPREMLVTKPAQKILNGTGILSKILIKIKRLLGYNNFNNQTSATSLDHIQFFSLKKLKLMANKGGFSITKKSAGNFIDNTFPFSLVMKKSQFLQKADCFIADLLPLPMTSAFYTVWSLKTEN